MEKLETKVSEKIIRESLISNEYKRNKMLFKLYKMIGSINENMSIAIDGAWGTGKTFFVLEEEMIINKLCNGYLNGDQDDKDFIAKINKVEDQEQTYIDEKTLEDSKLTSIRTMYFDAWDKDDELDPLFSIMYQLIIETKDKLDIYSDDMGKKLIETLVNIMTKTSVGDLLASSKYKDDYEDIISKNKLKIKVNNIIDQLLCEKYNKIVIFIDELDRCKPKYAINLLERVKHYLTDERVIVIYSTNLEQLQHIVKSYYGLEFDAYNYLCRFFDLRISLPEVDIEDIFKKSIEKDDNVLYYEMALTVAKHLKMTIRDVQQYINLLKIAFGNRLTWFINHLDNKNEVKNPLIYVLPIIVGYYLKNIDTYNQIIDGKNPEAVCDILEKNNNEYLKRQLLDYKNHGSIKEEYIRFYNGIFKYKYLNKDSSYYQIGSIVLTYKSKECLIESMSLLSDINVY